MTDYLLPDGRTAVLLSAESPEVLAREAAAVLDYLERHPDVASGAVATMLFRTRVARRERALAMVRTRTELLDALRAVAAARPHPQVVADRARNRKTAYVFPGQGSQRPGMGKVFYANSEPFRAAVDEADDLFGRLYDFSPRDYLLADEYPEDVRVVQPALFLQMIGIAAMWRAAGVRPDATVGHSQGEISAVCVAGATTLADGVRVVTTRARAVHELSFTGYSMAVLGIDRDECEALAARTSGWVELSVINSAHLLCISGDRDAVLELVAKVEATGRFAKEIRVQYPAHTSLVNKFRTEFTALAGDMDNQTFRAPEIDCIGATLGEPITADLPLGDYWFWNLRNRVRFDAAVDWAARSGIDTFVEVAEHPTLVMAVQETLGSTVARDYRVLGAGRRTVTDLSEFARNVAAVAVADLGYDWESLRVDAAAASLPLRDFPPTPMHARRLWAEPTPAAPTAPAEQVVPERLVERWEPLPRRSMLAPKRIRVIGSDELAAAQGPVDDYDTVVVVAAPSQAAVSDDVAAAVSQFGELCTALAPVTPGVREYWLVTRNGEAVSDGDTPDLAHAAVASGFRCLATEHLGVAFRHLDTDAAASANKILDAVHTAAEPELALRNGKLYAKRLVSAESVTATPDLTEVVILGGTGHVGLAFCAEFVRAGARRITLVSRSAQTDVATLRALGHTEIVLAACDLTDEAAVAALATQLGPVTTLVHTAVNYVYGQTDSAAVAAAGAAKVSGLQTALRLLPLAPDCGLLLCSSFAATLGGRDQMVYAGTNRMLDALAVRLRADGHRATSVQWGLWELPAAADADVQARIAGSGLLPMAADAAVAAGLAGLADAANSVVVAADWAKLGVVAGTVGLDMLFPDLESLAAEAADRAAENSVPSSNSVPNPNSVPSSSSVPNAHSVPGSSSVPNAHSVPNVDGLGSDRQRPAALDRPELESRLRGTLNHVMGADGSDSFDPTAPLVALGLDSLQALDFRKRVQSELGRDLPVTAVLGGASFDDVVSLLTKAPV